MAKECNAYATGQYRRLRALATHGSDDSLVPPQVQLQIADHLSCPLIFGDLLAMSSWPAWPAPSLPVSQIGICLFQPRRPPRCPVRLHSKAPLLHDKGPYIHPRVDCSNIIQHRACQGEVASGSVWRFPSGMPRRREVGAKRMCTQCIYHCSCKG